MSDCHIKKAIQIINRGGVICYPTESVYGLGCAPYDLEAVLYLIALKKRSIRKGLLLVAGNVSQLEPYIDINDTLAITNLTKATDKPMTWIVTCNPSTPPWLIGEHQTIAVRISNHPIIKQLCTEFNGAIVSTSANISGQRSARSHWLVRKRFGKKIDYYVPGDLGAFKSESEIRNSITGEVIRASGK